MITKEFLFAEIQSLEQESQKAQTFMIQAQATIAAYQMLIRKLDQETALKGEQNAEKGNIGQDAPSEHC